MTEQQAIKEIRNCLGFSNIIEPYSDEMEAFSLAIAALQKQTPIKPVLLNPYFSFTGCPTCGTRASTNYCTECGQRIDWEV